MNYELRDGKWLITEGSDGMGLSHEEMVEYLSKEIQYHKETIYELNKLLSQVKNVHLFPEWMKPFVDYKDENIIQYIRDNVTNRLALSCMYQFLCNNASEHLEFREDLKTMCAYAEDGYLDEYFKKYVFNE
jgi:hypothetical protein